MMNIYLKQPKIIEEKRLFVREMLETAGFPEDILKKSTLKN